MKKTIALLLCLCMLACLFVGCASTSTTEQQTSGNHDHHDHHDRDRDVRVRQQGPQDWYLRAADRRQRRRRQAGDAGPQYGNYVQPTIEIGGETYDIQLEIVDNRTTAENGPSAASELVNRGVSIVLGSYGSGVSMAGGKVFEEAGIPAIGIGCTNPQVVRLLRLLPRLLPRSVPGHRSCQLRL